MEKLKALTSNGQAREVKDNRIRTDDGIELDITKEILIKTIIPQFNNADIPSTRKSLLNAENILIKGLVDDFKFDMKYKECSLEGYDTKENLKSFKRVVEFIDQPRENDGFKSLMLYGDQSYGCGKTHLINAIANKWFKSPRVSIAANRFGEIIMTYTGVSYQLIREEDLLLKILDTYNKESKNTELSIYNDLAKYDILAIDDVGKFTPSRVEFYRRVMFQIVDTRYNQRKGIILSTNFDKKDLVNFLGVAIADRLNEMTRGYQLEFKGKSHRSASNKAE